jgi:hypothetical protein
MWLIPDDLGSEAKPVCTCDYCLRPITAADPGGPVIPRRTQPGKTYVVQQAHNGRCRDCLEERLATERNHPQQSKKDDQG